MNFREYSRPLNRVFYRIGYSYPHARPFNNYVYDKRKLFDKISVVSSCFTVSIFKGELLSCFNIKIQILTFFPSGYLFVLYYTVGGESRIYTVARR